MKDAISYLKLDLRISKKSLLMTIPAVIFMGFIFWEKKGYMMAMSYLLLILIVCAITPFYNTAYEKLEKVYNVFPTRVSHMVLGRYMYLILWILTVFSVEYITMIYLHNINEIHSREIITMCFCEIVVAMICFVEYALCYKLGEVNKVIISFLHVIPGMAVFIIYPYLIDHKIISDMLINFIISSRNMVMVFCAFIVASIGYVSYLISCKICKRKEV